MKRIPVILAICATLFSSLYVCGQKSGITFENQVSSWLGVTFDDKASWQAGARYIPTLSPSVQLNKKAKIDAELSFNAHGNLLFSGFNFDTVNYTLDPYRLWLRYSTSRLEIRAGLQKISFGSANVLRPLMWFDKMDFRDPLLLTEGVYAVLGRYYFKNNANIWLWSLYGNNKVKGWETAPSLKDVPEYGGRFQLPVPKGELAFSYHHRDADFSTLTAVMPLPAGNRFTEQMFALDGKWDVGPGIWFGYVGKLNEKNNPFGGGWETYFNLGADYTLLIGSGVNIATEFFHYSNNHENADLIVKRNLTVLSASYPLRPSHNLSGMLYYNWDSREWYRIINLQLKYDYLSFYFIGFWNPDNSSLYGSSENNASFAGKGLRVMIVLDI